MVKHSFCPSNCSVKHISSKSTLPVKQIKIVLWIISASYFWNVWLQKRNKICQFGQICFAIWTKLFVILDKYIFFNLLFNLDDYILIHCQNWNCPVTAAGHNVATWSLSLVFVFLIVFVFVIFNAVFFFIKLSGYSIWP